MECDTTDGQVRNTRGCPADVHLGNPTSLAEGGQPYCHTSRESPNMVVSIGPLRLEYLIVVTHVTVRIRGRHVRSTSEGVSRTRVIGRCRAWTGTSLALKTAQERDLSSFQYLATLQKSRMGDTEKDRSASSSARPPHVQECTRTEKHNKCTSCK